jgi:hypothetical protein
MATDTPFKNPDGELDDTAHPRTYAAEVGIALSAIDGTLLGAKAIYASSPMTTGRRFYDLLRAHGVTSGSELKADIGRAAYRAQVFDANVAVTNAFARAVRDRMGGAHIVISPGPFDAPGWNQAEYLAFWEALIRTRVGEVWFNDGWQHSNGCAFEYAVALDAGLATRDATGQPLESREALELIGSAVESIDAGGFDSAALRESLGRIRRASGG